MVLIIILNLRILIHINSLIQCNHFTILISIEKLNTKSMNTSHNRAIHSTRAKLNQK